MSPVAPDSCRVVLCTCPDPDTAQRLAAGLVDQGFAACVNVVGGIRSIYRWQNEVHDEAETLMIIKTTQARYRALEDWLRENHPYEVPEVLALPVAEGFGRYLDWVGAQTR